MRSILDEFTKEAGELRTLVASIAPVNLALSEHQDSHVRQYISIRRRFDNAAFAVALYASFEKFIEDLVAAYVALESRRVQYSALPQKLAGKHLQRSAELLRRGRIGEGRYAGLSALSVVKNLFDCLSGSDQYSLNEAAVIAHDSNLRAGEIDELFAAVGMEQICERLRRADALGDWYTTTRGPEALPQDGVKRTVIEERLKDIVERRNQVAHRGGSPLDLLGVDAMNEAIGFIEGFSKSVFAMVVGRYLDDNYATSPRSAALIQRPGDGPYRNGTVVVIEKPILQLSVGQPLFVIIESAGARWGRIQSLVVDDVTVQAVEVDAFAAQGVGVGLDFKCPKDATLVALATEDDLVWSPRVVAA